MVPITAAGVVSVIALQVRYFLPTRKCQVEKLLALYILGRLKRIVTHLTEQSSSNILPAGRHFRSPALLIIASGGFKALARLEVHEEFITHTEVTVSCLNEISMYQQRILSC
jgi:hypothetical protein